MNLIKGLVIVVIIGSAGGIAFSYSGIFDVSATVSDSAPVKWLLENTRKHSILKRSKNIESKELSDVESLGGAAKAYLEMCAGCHSAPGSNTFLGAKDMNPPPPELVDLSNQRTPEELFWVIKNGIRMTGMPAWGRTHSDKEIWELVALIKHLPDLTADKFTVLANSVEDDGHDHDHGVSGQSDMDHHDEQTAYAKDSVNKALADELQPQKQTTERVDTLSKPASSKADDDHYSDGHTH